MKFSLIIATPPENTSQLQLALDFAKSLVNQNHLLTNVFFLNEAVALATTKLQRLDDIATRWSTLSQTHGFQLSTCITDYNLRYPESDHPVREHFSLDGMGQLAEASEYCDRLITFR